MSILHAILFYYICPQSVTILAFEAKSLWVICFDLQKSSSTFFLTFLFIFDRKRERERDGTQAGGGRERGRHRIRSRLQALSCQHRARCRARTHELQDHDLSQSKTLNQLSHPGAPTFLKIYLKV